MKRVGELRKGLAAAGLEVIGNPSAIVPVPVGEEAFARLVARQLPEFGVVTNLVEYPAVAKGSARFRFQVMSRHTAANITDVVQRFRGAVDAGQAEYAQYQRRSPTRVQSAQPQLMAVGA